MRCVAFTLCVFAVVFGCGCNQAGPSAAAPVEEAPQQPRVVSLSPAISRTLIDLEMDQLIVGRTPFCDSLDRSLPVVGDLLDLNYEALIRVKPTHVLVQPQASGIDARLRGLAQERGWSIHAWHLDGLNDVAAMLGELPRAVFEDDLRAQSAAMERANELLEQFVDLFHPLAPSIRPLRTLLIVGVEPVTVFGHGTYLHEILLAIGDRNAIDMNGYPQLTLEDVARLNPQAMILVRPSGRAEDVAAFGPLLKLEVDAVRDRRIAILSHPDALLPSSGVVGVAKDLRAILASFREGE